MSRTWNRDPNARPNFKQISNELTVILQKEKNALGIQERRLTMPQGSAEDAYAQPYTAPEDTYQNLPHTEESEYDKLYHHLEDV